MESREMEIKVLDEVIENLKQAIKDSGLSQDEIGVKIGYSKKSGGLGNALKRKSIRLSEIIKIADLLEIKTIDLFPKDFMTEWLKMPLIDLIREICHKEIKKVLLESKIENEITLKSPIKKK